MTLVTSTHPARHLLRAKDLVDARYREPPTTRGSWCTLEGDIPAARVHELRRQLPALTRGEGVVDCAFDRHESVTGTEPTRPRTDRNPLSREEYLLRVARGGPIG